MGGDAVWIGPEEHRAIGSFLAGVRREAGVAQVELARRLGKPQSFVSAYERGQRRVDFLEMAQIVLALEGDVEKVGTALVARVARLASTRGHRDR